MADYGLSQALESRDPLAKLRAQLQLDETQATGRGFLDMLASWARWRTKPDAAPPFDPMQPLPEGFDPPAVPFEPGGIAAKLGKVSGAVKGGTPLSDILGAVDNAFPALMAKVQSAPRTIDVQGGPFNAFGGRRAGGGKERAGNVLGAYVPGTGKKRGNMGTVHISDTATSPFNTLLHELIHTRNEAKMPTARQLRTADRSLTPDDRRTLDVYGIIQTPESVQEEAYTRALTNRLMRRARLVPQFEDIYHGMVGPAIQAERAGQVPDLPVTFPLKDWWIMKELYKQHPNAAGNPPLPSRRR
jgi:hypothetical protein